MPLNSQPIRKSTLRVVRAGPAFRGKQGHIYAPALSAAWVGAEHIHMQMLTIPPGESGRAHKHDGHETAIYILRGESGVFYGEHLEHHQTAGDGDYVYIPAGMPHMPYNTNLANECVAIIARTDPDEQESVVLLPELEAEHAQIRAAAIPDHDRLAQGDGSWAAALRAEQGDGRWAAALGGDGLATGLLGLACVVCLLVIQAAFVRGLGSGLLG